MSNSNENYSEKNADSVIEINGGRAMGNYANAPVPPPSPNTPMPPKEKNGRGALAAVIAVAVIALLILTVIIGLIAYSASHLPIDDPSRGDTSIITDSNGVVVTDEPTSPASTREYTGWQYDSADTQPIYGGELEAVEAAEKAYPSCVTIEVTYDGSGKASGSGVFWTTDGFILTNHHVISGADTIKVTLDDGRVYTAKLWAGSSTDDLALIKIEPKSGERFTPVEVSLAEPRRGQSVFAIGNAIGLYSNTLTKGVISYLGRDITVEGIKMNGMLQHDAMISPGNSGGGLFNSAGQLIGINSAKSSDDAALQIGFAIPVSSIMSVVPYLLEDRYVPNRPKIGISVVTVTSDNKEEIVKKYPDIKAAVDAFGTGVYVVLSTNPMLKVGDKLLSVDGKMVSDSSSVISAVTSHNPGDKIQVRSRYLDGGVEKEKIVSVEIFEKAPSDFQ